MDRLFAVPPSRPRSKVWIVASAGFHLTCIGVLVAIAVRLNSAPTPPRHSITFISAATAIGFTRPPDSGVAPRIHRVASETARVTAAPEPAPSPPRPVDSPRVETVVAERSSAPVADPPAPPPETHAPTAAEERPAPVLGMFERVVSARDSAATGSVRAAGFGATDRPVFQRAAVDAAAQTARFDRAVTPRVSMTMAPPVAAVIDTPIEVLFKPSADYTDEARMLRIEGEVVVEAAFGQSGQVSVVRVVQGLGHGLDEMATRAVSGIQFRPATRGGVPVDVRTFVHIEFHLA